MALAIKKVRLFQTTSNVEMRISTEMARTNKEYKDTDANIATFALSGQAIFQTEDASVTL